MYHLLRWFFHCSVRTECRKLLLNSKQRVCKFPVRERCNRLLNPLQEIWCQSFIFVNHFIVLHCLPNNLVENKLHFGTFECKIKLLDIEVKYFEISQRTYVSDSSTLNSFSFHFGEVMIIGDNIRYNWLLIWIFHKNIYTKNIHLMINCCYGRSYIWICCLNH